AGTANTGEVFYIKKQATYNNVLYYLISRNPSAVTGVIGWVKATDMSSAEHSTINSTKKVLYIKGSGNAYGNAWGGTKNQISLDLTKLQNQTYEVNLTERVGEKIWYRGVVDGKTAWIEEANVAESVEQTTSRLGHLNSTG